MKGTIRLIRRFLLLTVCVVPVLFFLNLAMFIAYTWRERSDNGGWQAAIKVGEELALGSDGQYHLSAAGQQILADYMAGRLLQLVLVWHCEAGGDYTNHIQKRCIVLMQDQGSHVMIWLESDRGGMEYLVSDVNEYLDADEKRYRKKVQ